MREKLHRKRRKRSPNGVRRETTTQPSRNFLTVDMGDDLWGIKRRLEAKAKAEGRTVSGLVRDILKHVLIDWG